MRALLYTLSHSYTWMITRLTLSDLLDRAAHAGANRYLDTRGNITDAVTFTEAVIDGLASGGGLFVPEQIPQLTLDEIIGLADVPYPVRAVD